MDTQKEFERIVSDLADRADLLLRSWPYEVWVYHQPSTETKFGEFYLVTTEPPPEGASLSWQERLPRNMTKSQLRAWMYKRARRLPLLPFGPRQNPDPSADEPVLRKIHVVRQESGVPSYQDRRFRVDRYVVGYRDPENVEYRKCFEVAPGAAPVIPEQGTHDELNALRWQRDLRQNPSLPSRDASLLRYAGTVRVDLSVRARQDAAVIVDRYVVQYLDPEYHKIRLFFETEPGTTPNIPGQGTRAELDALECQYGSCAKPASGSGSWGTADREKDQEEGQALIDRFIALFVDSLTQSGALSQRDQSSIKDVHVMPLGYGGCPRLAIQAWSESVMRRIEDKLKRRISWVRVHRVGAGGYRELEFDRAETIKFMQANFGDTPSGVHENPKGMKLLSKQAEDAADVWLDFNRSPIHPRDEIDLTIRIRAPWPTQWYYAGAALETRYSSDKWNPRGAEERYYHEHKAGVGVWVPASAAERFGLSTGTKNSVDFPYKVPEAAALLGSALEVEFRDPNGAKCRLEFQPGAQLISSPDRKALFVLEKDAGEVVRAVAAIAGGALGVEPRGIVG